MMYNIKISSIGAKMMLSMVIRVVDFSSGELKLERFLPKNQRKLLNFEFWINGERLKIGQHFSNIFF